MRIAVRVKAGERVGLCVCVRIGTPSGWMVFGAVGSAGGGIGGLGFAAVGGVGVVMDEILLLPSAVLSSAALFLKASKASVLLLVRLMRLERTLLQG